jgi:phosphomannomutase
MPKPMDLDAIFKAYDVRGVVPDQLDATAARRIGYAFARFVDAPRIAVGRDVRTSSPVLATAFCDGVHAAGVDVDDLGMITTDMVYFAAGHLDEPGAMITASHNPKGYNGIKMCLAGAAPVGADSGLVEIRRLADDEIPTTSTGTSASVDVLQEYVDHVIEISGADSVSGLRVGADGGNGVAGVAIPAIFDRLEVDLIPLYLDPDGTFPNHHPDPLRPENLEDLKRLIATDSPDFGVAFDGDADRAFFIDDAGETLPGSTVTAMVARWFLARRPGSTIVHNLICSRAVPETVRRHGGTPIRTRVGHSYIKAVMAETGAVFGGEHSGHYYFADNYRADSGILAMLVLMRLVSEAGSPLSELRREYEPYRQSGEINMQVSDPTAEIERVAAAFENGDRLDGLTVDLGDRWFNLRPSNTEPVLRLNVEAPDAGAVQELVDRVRSLIREVDRAGAA